MWSTADGSMGGGFVMVKASNFACKSGGYLGYLRLGTTATYSYRKNFDANREIASFQRTDGVERAGDTEPRHSKRYFLRRPAPNCC